MVDGTDVKEPGPTGSCWRVHYAVGLPSLRCTELYVTKCAGEGTGETFRRFQVAAGDLFIGDRAYGRAADIAHVARAQGAVLTRFTWTNLPLWSNEGERFDLLAHLRTLPKAEPGDWPVAVADATGRVRGRVCAVRRSRQAAEEAQRKATRKAQKNGTQITAETLEAAEYLFVFTTLTAAQLSPAKVLEFYRGRWQVELVFKRLKSIVGLGHLRKDNEEMARAWIHGKLFVAFLLEAMLRCGETFFPLGLPALPAGMAVTAACGVKRRSYFISCSRL